MHHLGHTRSANRRDHLLHTSDAFVRTPLPELTGGLAIVHAAPQLGAAFSMMTVELEPGGTLMPGPVQSFVYVLDGALELAEPEVHGPQMLEPGGFAYLPPAHAHRLQATAPTRLIVVEKPYLPLHPGLVADPHAAVPPLVLGSEQAVEPKPLNGDPDLLVRALLPVSTAYDFAVNTMTYAPGASLAQVEIHYMEHGLLMLDGGGIYRLGDAWYPVQAGDFIWMAPFCPQWFGALGKKPARYLIYKDFNRHVLA